MDWNHRTGDVLTLVLFHQFEAIGFLITGKGIVRFAGRKSHVKSEYVLLGTLMSYGLALLGGTALLKFFEVFAQ